MGHNILVVRTLERLRRQGQWPSGGAIHTDTVEEHPDRVCATVRVTVEVSNFELEEQRILDKVEAALIDLGAACGNKNASCFPLGSFGWKDADLTPSGCTGIKSVWGADEGKVVIEIGGHKTDCDGSGLPYAKDVTDLHKESYDEASRMLVSGAGYDAEWTGDDWSLSFSDKVRVDAVIATETGDVDYPATAQHIREVCEAACANFEEAVQYVSAEQDILYGETSRCILRDAVVWAYEQNAGKGFSKRMEAVIDVINDVVADSAPCDTGWMAERLRHAAKQLIPAVATTAALWADEVDNIQLEAGERAAAERAKDE